MRKVLRKRRACSHQVHSPCPLAEGGEGLPRFSKALGLDFIITPEGRGVLIELQHGFGKRGLLRLFPAANRAYRRRFRSLIREHGTCFELISGLRSICHDKTMTYQYFSAYQPPSLAYRRWDGRVEAWLGALDAEVVLVKPPQESCGRGIKVFGRRELLGLAGAAPLPSPGLIQAFVPCRPLPDEAGEDHVGCIRHIVVMVSDGAAMSFIHLPSYWRVSPRPRGEWRLEAPDREALTANISRGAYPLPVEEADEVTVRAVTEAICLELVGLCFGRSAVPRGTTGVISADGTLPEGVESPAIPMAG